MPFGAVVGIGLGVAGAGSIVSGILGASAAKRAAAAQTQAAQNALNFTQGVYNTGQQNLQPYIGTGQQALSALAGFYGLPGGNAGGALGAFNQFTQLPSYLFPLQQGQLGINRQLAASGLTGSGAALREASLFNQQYASTGLGSYLSGLGGLAGAGQGAAGTLLSGGNVAGQTIANAYGYMGNAQAQGIVGANNALTQGVQNALPYLFGSPGGAGGGGMNVGGSSYGSYGSPGLFPYIGSSLAGGGGGQGFGSAIGNYG